jgi:hypothetical protein
MYSNKMGGALSKSVIAAVCVVLLTSCESVRLQTYPKNYTYMSHGTVTSTMSRLAVSIDRLDLALVTVSLQQHEKVITELKSMEEIASSLAISGEHTNHLLIDENLDKFRSGLRAARRAVEENPPNYYPAGKLAGSCTGCHVLR